MMDENLWTTIPKYPSYEINQQLQVRHKKLKKIKKFYTDENGYYRTNIEYNGKKVKPGQHQLVALTFIPNPENKPEVNHKDGDKKNNEVSNLEWATQLENKQHALENGLVFCKLKFEDVSFIRENYFILGVKALSEKFNVTAGAINCAATGRTRKSVNILPIKLSRYKKIINIETKEIYESIDELAQKEGFIIRNLRRKISGERYNNTPFRYLGQEDLIKEKSLIEVPKSPIAIFDNHDSIIHSFDYKSEAAIYAQCKVSRINEYLAGKSASVKGYKFKLIDQDGNYIEPIPFVSKKPPLKPKRTPQPITPSKGVVKFDLNNNELERFTSINEAARSMGTDKSNFKKALKKGRPDYYKGYIFKISSF